MIPTRSEAELVALRSAIKGLFPDDGTAQAVRRAKAYGLPPTSANAVTVATRVILHLRRQLQIRDSAAASRAKVAGDDGQASDADVEKAVEAAYPRPAAALEV